MAHWRHGSLSIEELSLANRSILEKTECLAAKYELDIVDAHQRLL